MSQSGIKYCVRFVICFWVCLLIGGCISQERIERDFQANREASYQALQRNAEGESTEEIPVISGKFTFADCLELTLVHNRDVQTAKIQLLQAEGQMTEAIATALPIASFSANALRNDNSGFATQKETYQLQTLIRQPLYLGGLAGAAIDAAAVYSYMTGQQLRQTVHDVQLLVRQKYLAAVLTEELVKVAQQAKRDAQEHLTDTQAKLKHGVGTRFDVLRAQVRVNAVQAELIQLQNAAHLALTNLLDEMGVSQFSKIELTEPLNYEQIEPVEKESLYQAMMKRPELLIGEAMVRLAKDNIKAERATNLPKVYLQGMHQLDYPGFAANFEDFASFGAAEEGEQENSNGGGQSSSIGSFGKEWERTMNAGIVIEWPLFDGFRTDGLVTQAKAQMHSQQINLIKMEQQVQLQVTQSLLNLQSSDKFVQSQQGNVSNAEESLRLAQVKFREGAGSSLDVISAETALTTARSNYLQAVHDYQLAQVKLEWAVGIIGEE